MLIDNELYEALVVVTEGCHDAQLMPRWYGKPDATSEDGC